MIKKIILLLAILIAIPLSAQTKKDKVIFTIDDEPVYVSEFLRVYNKNKNVVSAENRKNIEEYMELFINYKLKLRDAKAMKLDTVSSYIIEFNKYKEQLIEPYLKDRVVSDKLVLEAYNRLKNEVRARHILIKVGANAKPIDTLVAYNRILDARKLIIDGASFTSVANDFSDDKDRAGKVNNGGDLGYFSAFAMLYPFETAAYETKIGDISMPFKTKYGYHIVKVDDVRESKGEVQVAHIMIRDKKMDKNFAKSQIDDIYNKFKQGEDFAFLAKKYSDDKASSVKGGVIRKFTLGKMLQPFADISFSLKKVDDVSKPFKTKFGWHIVKLVKKFPVPSFENSEEDLVKKIEKGDRSVLIGKSISARLKKEYDVNVNMENITIALDKNNKNYKNGTVLTIKEKQYSIDELKAYLANKKANNNYKGFVDEKVMGYYKDNLEVENPEFAATLKEYRDGLLLFDLLQKKIWTKAEKDTVGLQGYFDNNKSNYNWKKRVNASIASCTKKEKATLVQKLMNEGKSLDEIKESVNEGATIHVLFNEGTYEVNSNKLPQNFVAKEGVSMIHSDKNNHYTIVNVSEVLAPASKELKDVKGKVISNYQDHLELEWIKNLRSKYKVEVIKKALKKVIRKNK
ncbi:MAG: peptidylprolyl isomerase [Flavobacteriaceae bacterium]